MLCMRPWAKTGASACQQSSGVQDSRTRYRSMSRATISPWTELPVRVTSPAPPSNRSRSRSASTASASRRRASAFASSAAGAPPVRCSGRDASTCGGHPGSPSDPAAAISPTPPMVAGVNCSLWPGSVERSRGLPAAMSAERGRPGPWSGAAAAGSSEPVARGPRCRRGRGWPGTSPQHHPTQPGRPTPEEAAQHGAGEPGHPGRPGVKASAMPVSMSAAHPRGCACSLWL